MGASKILVVMKLEFTKDQFLSKEARIEGPKIKVFFEESLILSVFLVVF